jgi:RHS repeat-associated protein
MRMDLCARGDSGASGAALLRGRQAAGVALLAVMLGVAAPAEGKTIVTDYTYNADGALTAITTSVDGGASTTKYLTWDNFVPDENDPATGTVSIGNGRLLGWGPKPGIANLTDRFEFDRRDRLLSYSGGAASETYDYHAGGMMASSSAQGDALRFYYDTSANPQATNLHQEQTDLWSGYLGGVRYLNDGSEQVLLQPRKDTTGTYDAGKGTVRSYAYDAYGVQATNPPSGTYDLQNNPFQYAGEYRSPMWGGTYLRARWYDPDLPGFISRDPVANLNRYGYAGANPVMNIDPSGESYQSAVGNPVGHFLQKLNSGVGGHFARIFLAPLIGPLQIVASPGGFWDAVKHNRDGIDIFLAAGIATEGASIGLEGLGLSSFVRSLSLQTRFASRLLVDSGLAGGQAVAAGADRGFQHFNWDTFGQNLELAGGGLAYSRGVVGEGYHPYTLKGTDVATMVQHAGDGKFLIFRERTRGYNPLGWTSPVSEKLRISNYHERIIAVSKDFSMMTEVVVDVRANIGFRQCKFAGSSVLPGSAPDIQAFLGSRTSRFQFVGEAERNKAFNRSFMAANPSNFPRGGPDGVVSYGEKRARYHLLTNNCHSHAQGVLRALGF